jgi:hypothetical protein
VTFSSASWSQYIRIELTPTGGRSANSTSTA